MNWPDVPNLFANGRFKAQVNWTGGTKSIKDINGYFNSYPFEHAFLDGKDYLKAFDLGDTAMPIEHCTLIARKIEGMTGDEIDKLKAGDAPAVRMPKMIHGVNFESYLTDDFLYLLSIGVYPFDQKHFEDGAVIDINSL